MTADECAFVGLARPVAHQVNAKFALGSFDRVIDFADRRFDILGTLAITGPSGRPSSACSMITADCFISSMRTR